MKKKTKVNIAGTIVVILVVIGLKGVITAVWQGLELLLYHEIQYRKVDDIIATILLISLLLNLKFALEKIDLDEEKKTQ